jgi:magnesium transporter
VTIRVLDLVDPTPGALIEAVPQLDPERLEWLAAPASDGRDARPTLESHGSAVVGLFLIPVHVDEEDRFVYLELGVVVAPDLLVTIRKSGPNGLAAAPSLREVTDTAASPAGSLLHGLVDDVVASYLDLVDALYQEIDQLEDSVQDVPGAVARLRLSLIRHEMLHARKNVTATRAEVRRVVDGRLDLWSDRLFPREVEVAFADTYDTLVRITEELDVARDLLASVRDYLQSKIAENQNEVVKKLTVVASLVLVPTLITGFYGQNFESAFDSRLWNIGTSIGLIIATTVIQLVFFHWKKWI